MEVKLLSALWGYEDQPLEFMLDRIAGAGYQGVDTFMPEDAGERKRLLRELRSRGLSLIAQQYQAEGAEFAAFKSSYLHYLALSAEGEPLLINSHTGRDYFSFDQNLELTDIAQAFTERTGITVSHETHRGRFLYSPGEAARYFAARPEMRITADLSHWVCVSESFLENFPEPLGEAIRRATHVHARIGYEEGPQVPDPRAPEWADVASRFLGWWDAIVEHQYQAGAPFITITTEFGPPPYMPLQPFTAQPVADLFEVNCYMLDVLTARYGRYAEVS